MTSQKNTVNLMDKCDMSSIFLVTVSRSLYRCIKRDTPTVIKGGVTAQKSEGPLESTSV